MDGWSAVIFMIISAYISYSMMPKVQNRTPEAFADIEFPQFEEGTPQAVIFGDCWSSDWAVIAVGDYRTEEIRGESGK
jgi:hypothetical protein